MARRSESGQYGPSSLHRIMKPNFDFTDPDALAEHLVRTLGRRIVLALPLGLGKANHVANALYARAAQDRSISLRIFTALSLEKPHYGSELERRFLEPVIERLFGDYPELLYVRALREGSVPSNIDVNEFFFLAGRWLRVAAAQRSYISANYTHAARYVMERGVNVVGQLVARRETNGARRYSLCCNTDLTLDLLQARVEGRTDFLLVGQVNAELPFMPGAGDLPADTFGAVLDGPQTEHSLFAPPNEPVDLAEHAIGLNVARLVPDGGTLQIGIGQGGDAATHALILRHRENAAFREAIARLSPWDADTGHLAPFDAGLYGLSEMFVAGFLALLKAGVLKREVDGALLHGAFFLGPKSFYRSLRELDEATLAKLRMTAVSFTNELYGDEAAKRAARVGARFVNSTMMATLLGAAVSDALEDGRVVSGVGGQYNFVAQAFALADARSILTFKATRSAGGKASSNTRFAYGHETIPRHLRDVFITEYGVADLRGKTDEETVQAMLAVADSRFQPELMRAAKDADKLAKTYEIPKAKRENTPERIAAALAPLRARGCLPEYPFGTDFSESEQRLLPALEMLSEASASPLRLAKLALQGFSATSSAQEQICLERMALDKPRSWQDRIYQTLLRATLYATRKPAAGGAS